VPLQNRVTPFGELAATSARGRLTGNRGIIHDPATQTLLNRRWSSKAWIACSCEWKGVNRSPIWTRRTWTELFFLDEATALAAGHRPCFTCRRSDANEFRDTWAIGNRIAAPTAAEMDKVLHAERLEGKRKRLHPVPDDLPDGAMVTAGNKAFLIAGGRPYRWSFEGYSPAPLPAIDGLLTPPSIVNALRAGYRPAISRDLAT
jgi:hypothetical protein